MLSALVSYRYCRVGYIGDAAFFRYASRPFSSGYVLSAIPDNYTDEPPSSLADVRRNLNILQKLIKSLNEDDRYNVRYTRPLPLSSNTDIVRSSSSSKD